MLTAYKVCCLYRALKLHFTTDYNFNLYKGKVNYTVSQFNANPHRFVYEKLANKYTKEPEIIDFLVANFLENPNVWVQDLLNGESFETYITYLRRKQSLGYNFQKDLNYIFDVYKYQKEDIFKSVDGSFPLLMMYAMNREVCIETLVILDSFLNIINNWDKKIKDDIIWPTFRNKVVKYKSFVSYNKEDFRSVLKEHIKAVS